MMQNSIKKGCAPLSFENDLNQGYEYYSDQKTNQILEKDRLAYHERRDSVYENVSFFNVDAEVHDVYRYYFTNDDYNLVTDFLRVRPNVLRFLRSAYVEIKRYFPSSQSINISVSEGYEEGEPDSLLVNVIIGNDDIDSAVEKYNQFLDAWWFKQAEENRLNVLFGIL